MKPTTPLLPETTFAPLPQARLEQMIDHALTHQQHSHADNVVAFRPRTWMFGSGMAAMAASIMLTFMLTPQMNTGSLTLANATVATTTQSTDINDLLLFESLGA